MSQPDQLHEGSDARGDAAPLYLHSVLAFAAKAGALLLASGAGAADVVDAVLAVVRTAALDDVTVDVTYTELTISYHPDQDVPYTRVRTIPQRTFNYGKLTKATQLVERYCQGQLTLSAAGDELRRLLSGDATRGTPVP